MCPKARFAIALTALFLAGLLVSRGAYADDTPLEAPGTYQVQSPTGSPPAPPLPNSPPGSRTPPQPAPSPQKTPPKPAQRPVPRPAAPTPPMTAPVPVPPLSPMPEEAPLPTPVTGAARNGQWG